MEDVKSLESSMDSCMDTLTIIMSLLERAAETFENNVPDELWFREYFLILGDHMVLTEEGWISARDNTVADTGLEPMEVLDEVNKPQGE